MRTISRAKGAASCPAAGTAAEPCAGRGAVQEAHAATEPLITLVQEAHFQQPGGRPSLHIEQRSDDAGLSEVQVGHDQGLSMPIDQLSLVS